MPDYKAISQWWEHRAIPRLCFRSNIPPRGSARFSRRRCQPCRASGPDFCHSFSTTKQPASTDTPATGVNALCSKPFRRTRINSRFSNQATLPLRFFPRYPSTRFERKKRGKKKRNERKKGRRMTRVRGKSSGDSGNRVKDLDSGNVDGREKKEGGKEKKKRKENERRTSFCVLVLATAVPRGSSLGGSRETAIPLLSARVVGSEVGIYVRVAAREHSVNTILRRAS